MLPLGAARHHKLLFAAVKTSEVADNVPAGRRRQPGIKPDAWKCFGFWPTCLGRIAHFYPPKCDEWICSNCTRMREHWRPHEPEYFWQRKLGTGPTATFRCNCSCCCVAECKMFGQVHWRTCSHQTEWRVQRCRPAAQKSALQIRNGTVVKSIRCSLNNACRSRQLD